MTSDQQNKPITVQEMYTTLRVLEAMKITPLEQPQPAEMMEAIEKVQMEASEFLSFVDGSMGMEPEEGN